MRKERLFCPECLQFDKFVEYKQVSFDECFIKMFQRKSKNPWILVTSAVLCNFCQCTIPLALARRRILSDNFGIKIMPCKDAVEMWRDEYCTYGLKKLW